MLSGALAVGAVLVIAFVTIHEAAHHGLARAVGVEPADLRFAMCGVNPCVVFAAQPTGWQRDLIDYSGGDAGNDSCTVALRVCETRWEPVAP